MPQHDLNKVSFNCNSFCFTMTRREPLNCNFTAIEHCCSLTSTSCGEHSTILDAHEIASQYCLEIPKIYYIKIIYNQMYPITFLFEWINVTKQHKLGSLCFSDITGKYQYIYHWHHKCCGETTSYFLLTGFQTNSTSRIFHYISKLNSKSQWHLLVIFSIILPKRN